MAEAPYGRSSTARSDLLLARVCACGCVRVRVVCAYVCVCVCLCACVVCAGGARARLPGGAVGFSFIITREGGRSLRSRSILLFCGPPARTSFDLLTFSCTSVRSACLGEHARSVARCESGWCVRAATRRPWASSNGKKNGRSLFLSRPTGARAGLTPNRKAHGSAGSHVQAGGGRRVCDGRPDSDRARIGVFVVARDGCRPGGSTRLAPGLLAAWPPGRRRFFSTLPVRFLFAWASPRLARVAAASRRAAAARRRCRASLVGQRGWLRKRR